MVMWSRSLSKPTLSATLHKLATTKARQAQPITHSKMYFECHITVEPIPEARVQEFAKLCKEFGFWSSDWALADKTYKFFATSRGVERQDIQERMQSLIKRLKEQRFKVFRYKIEDTILDSNISDELQLLDKVESEILKDFEKIGV